MGLLTKTVQLKMIGRHAKRYRQLGYVFKEREIIEVRIEDLPTHSMARVLCQCDEKDCDNIKEISYCSYNLTMKKNGFYRCFQCGQKTRKEVFLEKYGVDNPAKLPEIQEKIRQTTLERYGVERTVLVPEIRETQRRTMFENGTAPCSTQQKYIHDLYGGYINYPFNNYSLDILLDDIYDIEVDCSGHNLCVKHSVMSQEEFNRKEMIRNYIVERNGFKLIRIKSLSDLLPSDTILLQMLSDAKQYFSDYPNHSWVTFDIDEGIVKNAECKEGRSYFYGELRKINKKNLESA